MKVGTRQRREAWAKHARAKRCVICGARHVQGHHAVKQQVIKRQCQMLGLDYDRYCWDVRNCMALCERHHVAHHSKAHPVTLPIVLSACPKLVQFARELGIEWWLSREYPIRTPRR